MGQTGEASLWRWLVEDPAALRRVLLRVVAVAIFIAAATAILAVLGDSVDAEDWRVTGTSLGFAILSSTAAAGAALARDKPGPVAAVGVLTIVLSASTFAVLLLAVWTDADDDAWRGFGALTLLTLAASHASIVARAARPRDGLAIRAMTGASIALATLDCGLGALAFLGVVDIERLIEIDRASAVTLIALLATTALPPVLRRIAASAEPRVAATAPVAPVARRPYLMSAALACVVGLVGYALGSARRDTEVRYVAAPVAQPVTQAPPPGQAPSVPASGRPVPQVNPLTLPPPPTPASMRPAAGVHPFRCSSAAARVQLAHGPGVRVAVVGRGPQGVCVAAASDRIDPRRAGPYPNELAAVRFHHVGESEFVVSVEARDPHHYRVTLNDGDSGLVDARRGSVGVGPGVASFRIVRPRIPSWVSDEQTWSEVVVP